MVRLRDDGIEVLLGIGALLGVDGEISCDLASLGLAGSGDGVWTGSASLLEPVCSLLDRRGVVWGVYDPDGARTFGERLFAECPTEIAGDIYEALRTTLSRSSSTEMHLAALDSAWRSWHGVSDRLQGP